MKLLDCKNVTMNYDTHLAVNDISFYLEQGDYMCVVGENGSGKSTLMKGILGLLKPAKGSITFNGVKQNEIGYLPQQTIVQKDFPSSVFEIVLSGCLNRRGLRPFYSKKDKMRAIDNITKLGINDLQKKSYRDLSGGQQQRVLLARALCATEKLLLLDEPVTGLDPIVTSDLYTLIKKLNWEDGITIIMVSHDINNAVQYGNKILHMDTKFSFYGLKEEYISTNIFRQMMGGSQNAIDV